MKRNAAVLGVSAFALSVAAAAPASAVVLQDQPGVERSSASSDVRSETQSTIGLLGTGAAFLLLGMGSISMAHRRRWRTIDLRDATNDAGDQVVKAERA